ncbi:MAG: aldo/keto reductase [Clostridia bacterium]|nr:aldo/keto reductase [Clostridia bacterium]
MLYRSFKDKKLSLLSMGTMRLPTIDGKINEDETAEMIDYALKNGVNYFDTAWGYHSGESERVVGKILNKYPRDSYYIATKFPGYDLNNMGKVEEIFEEQLRKTGMEYFDFYLIHNVCELNIDEYLNPVHGTYEYLLKQKENGRIKHLGFSVHGTTETMNRFLSKYGKSMEFCQIQLNWIDYEFQKANEKIEILSSLNIPVWVMEPLRGGKLAKETGEMKAFSEKHPDFSPVKWSYRFLKSIEGVTTVLSGASSFEQMKDNIKLFSVDDPLTDSEKNDLLGFARNMTGGVPCTACRYCVNDCPMGIDIPVIIEMYNEYTFTGGGFLAPMRLKSIPEEHRPSACISCGKCKELCPQSIDIPKIMEDFTQKIK